MEGAAETAVDFLLEEEALEEVVEEVEEMERRMEESSLRPPFMARVPRSGTSELQKRMDEKVRKEKKEKI